ncbi:Class I glutamine amidotransferase-like protein [Rhypophila sp. PSN 637]
MTSTTNASHKGGGLFLEQPLKIAILLNSYRSPFINSIRDSYVRSIAAISPHSKLSFFYPADFFDQPQLAFPDPALFDLIIIGGGNVDPRKKHPWILRVHAFILDVIAHHPRKKMVGICWGHQTISLLFGGEIIDMDVPELGVTEAKMTCTGRRFFQDSSSSTCGGGVGGQGKLRMQQHHRRAVGVKPRGFHDLLVGNQSFLSYNNAILTFQGHPEKDGATAKKRVHDAARWFGTDVTDSMAVDELARKMDMEHDGAEIWTRVLQWARGGKDGMLHLHQDGHL